MRLFWIVCGMLAAPIWLPPLLVMLLTRFYVDRVLDLPPYSRHWSDVFTGWPLFFVSFVAWMFILTRIVQWVDS